jgi:hypothetical protein
MDIILILLLLIMNFCSIFLFHDVFRNYLNRKRLWIVFTSDLVIVILFMALHSEKYLVVCSATLVFCGMIIVRSYMRKLPVNAIADQNDTVIKFFDYFFYPLMGLLITVGQVMMLFGYHE